LDQNSIISELSGKSFDEARNHLKSLSQVVDATITLSPNIPFLPQILPQRAQNIKLVITTNE
ncbi:MAG TPA: hypothetical protein VJC10_03035, partial [Patescibacteria group bacterium]|nr:hypothetical protein [Patescibacteria group bacterium]